MSKKTLLGIDAINADESRPDLKVWWMGTTVSLMLGNNFMKSFRATSNLRFAIARWCELNGYRCTQIRDNHIWL